MTDRRWRTLAMLALLLAIAYFFVRGPFWPPRTRLWDYAVFASAAELWVRGHDPYDTASVTSNWAGAPPRWRVERHVGWIRSNAPPSTLVVLAPFGALGRTGGAIVYLLSTSLLMGYAAWRMARWADVRGVTQTALYAAGLLASTPVIFATASGNPIMLAAPLALLAFDRRGTAGGATLGLAAAAKVQIGGPLIALAFLRPPHRRMAIVASIVLVAIVGVGGGRLTAAGIDWRRGLAANVAETNGPGGMNDFARSDASLHDQLELQTALWPIVRDRRATQGLAWAIAGVTGVTLLIVARRREIDPLLLGAAAGALLLPLYHRGYDLIVAVPLFAAAAAAAASGDRRQRRFGLAVLACALPFYLPIDLDRVARTVGLPSGVREHFLFQSIVHTPRPWALLAIVWLAIHRIKTEANDEPANADRPEKSLART